MKNLLSFVIAVISVVGFSAQAESIKLDMKAGLWQNTIAFDKNAMSDAQAQQAEQMKVAMEEMKKQLANLPPEQRAQVEAMMKQTGMQVSDEGLSFNNEQVQMSAAGTTVKACITQAEIDRGQLPQNVAGCTTTLTQIGSNRYKSKHVCNSDQGLSGESDMTFTSPKAYSGKGIMKHMVDGKVQSMAFTMTGAWLENDCGAVKPNQ